MASKEKSKEEKENETEVQKLQEKWAEEDKKFKCEFDVEHLNDLISAAKGLIDSPNLANLIGALSKELKALNEEQKEKDEELREKREKEMAEAQGKDQKKAKEKAEKEAKENPPSPLHQPRDTRAQPVGAH